MSLFLLQPGDLVQVKNTDDPHKAVPARLVGSYSWTWALHPGAILTVIQPPFDPFDGNGLEAFPPGPQRIQAELRRLIITVLYEEQQLEVFAENVIQVLSV